MKKWLCLLLAGVLFFSLTACNDAPAVSDASGDSSAEFILVQENFIYTIAGEDDTASGSKTLTVADNATGKVIQTLRFADNEWFTKEPLYLIDVTFDGNADVIVPDSCSASGAFFEAYIWDATGRQYEYAPSFGNIPNVALDADGGMLLSRRTADKITSHGMYRYSLEDNDFILIRSLYWEPQTDSQSMLVTETDHMVDGAEEQTRRFSVPINGVTDVDKADAQMAPYFASGSVWDLDDQKWDVPLISRSAYLY